MQPLCSAEPEGFVPLAGTPHDTMHSSSCGVTKHTKTLGATTNAMEQCLARKEQNLALRNCMASARQASAAHYILANEHFSSGPVCCGALATERYHCTLHRHACVGKGAASILRVGRHRDACELCQQRPHLAASIQEVPVSRAANLQVYCAAALRRQEVHSRTGVVQGGS